MKFAAKRVTGRNAANLVAMQIGTIIEISVKQTYQKEDLTYSENLISHSSCNIAFKFSLNKKSTSQMKEW